MAGTPVNDGTPDGASPNYRAVVAAADELMLCPDLDTLFRRAVELAREKLGVERCAVFVEEDGWSRGTYGTDRHGRTTDERTFRRPLDEHYGQQVPPPPPEGPPWFVLDYPWLEWDGQTHREIGEGWTVLTPIRFSDKPIGVFYNDAAISGAPLDERLQNVIAVYCSMLGNIIERMRSVEALRRREQYLACLTEVSAELLNATDLDATLPTVLEQLRKVTGADWCYLFEHDRDASGRVLMSLRHEACGPRAESYLNRPDLQNLPWDALPIERWADELAGGSPICRHVADLPPDERGFLQTGGICAIAMLPLHVAGQWYGFVGFNSHDPNRLWSAQEIDLLSGAASVISSSIERIRAERGLRDSERRARATTDAAMDAIVMLDGQSRIAYANRAAEAMLGYDAREAIGKSPVDFLASPRVREAYTQELAQVRKTGTSRLLGQSIPLVVLRKDGTEVPIEYSAASIPIGSEWHCVVIMRDVAKRKQAEEELRHERDFVAATLDTAGALVCVLDRDGAIVRFNRACEEVTGYSFREVAGRKPWEFLIPPEEVETARTFFSVPADDEAPTQGETHWITKAGGLRLIVWSNTCLRDAEGQPEHIVATGLDVTEHRRAEEAYHALVEHSLQGLIILQDERIVFANPALCEISGYSQDQLKALSPEDVRNIVHPDDQEEVWGRVRDRLAGEAVPPRNEFRAIRKDGTLRWLEAHASLITYRGRPAVQVAYLDVTDRKRADRERAALGRLTSRLAASASIEQMAVVVREESDHLLGWDAHYFAVRDADSDRLRVVSLADTVEGTKVILPTGHLPPAELSPPIESVLNGESVLINRSSRAPGPLLTSFGDTERPSASIIYVPVRSGHVVIGILSVQSYSPGYYREADVQVMQQFADTVAPAIERAYAEQLRAESERKYRELVENANSIILNVDTHGVVTFFNEFAQQFFGFPEDEIVGRNVIGTIVPESPGSEQNLGRISREIFLDPERYATFESENTTQDDRKVWVSWTNKPVFNADAEPLGILHVGHDITKRKRLEEQLQRSGRLEAVDRLAGSIAHDFSNVLTGITGHVDLALLDLDPGSPATEDLRRARDLVKRAAGVTRQLMAFSRRQRLTPIPLDLNRLIGDLFRMLQPLLGENIELDFVPADQLGQVRADPSSIEQMLVNLAVNARDAMPDGGKLTIETDNELVGKEQIAGKLDLKPGPYVTLRVSDTGLGMDPETREHAFEPFFTTKDGAGVGLGLAAVYGVVKQHEGDISVTTRAGQGATFTIYLPRLDGAASPKPDRREQPPVPHAGETILVVDDEDAVRVVVQRALEARGYRVMATTSPDRARELFAGRHGDVSLLVTDVVMPGTTGQELYEQLSEQNPSLKALYMSGYNDESVLGMDFLADDLAFIHKPFTAEALARKVRDVLDHDAVISP
jgi:two-component system cell cycle sensor histidine kinase/response regulator CckA